MVKIVAKRCILIGLVMSILSLFGCSFSTSLQKEPSLDEVAQQIIQAFEENDTGPLETVISKSALDSSDLMLGIRYGHKLLKDANKIEVEYDGKTEGSLFLKGKDAKWFSCNYDVVTDRGIYKLSFQYFCRNEIYPSDAGLFRVFFVSEADDKKETEIFDNNLGNPDYPLHWSYGATYERAGIYNPEWQTTPPPEDYEGQKY